MKKILYVLSGMLVTTAVSAQVVNNGLITVNQGAVVTFGSATTNNGKIVNNGDINFKSDVANNGTFSSEGKVVFVGESLQTVSGSGLEVSELTLENDVNLASPLRVTKTLNFNRGVLVSDENSPVVFAANATHVGASDYSHIKGTTVIEETRDFEFPIGNGTTYRGYAVKSNNPQTLSTAYKGENPMMVSSEFSKSVERINENEYWVLKSADAGAATTIDLDAGYSDENQVTYLKNGSWKVANESILTNKSGLDRGVIFTSGRGQLVQTGLGIWPNPTQGEFNLKLAGLDDNVNATVEIVNQDGRIVLRKEGKISELRKVYSLPSGMSATELTVRLLPENDDVLVDKLVLLK